jgi:hypothetical protein
MKKTIFLGIAVLLALAVFSCGDPSLPKDEDNAGGITLTGPELAGGRALIPTVAQAGTDFYEASFKKSDGQIIRTTWSYARKGKIQLEPGAYDVILMAGRNADKTLLGVGQVTATTPASTLTPTTNISVTIAANTSALTFSVYPLTNNIIRTTATTFTTALSTGAPADTQATKDELGNTVPVFMITKSTAASLPTGVATTGTWKFLIGTTAQTTLLGASIFVNGAPTIYEVGFSAPDERTVPQKLVARSITAPADTDDISTGQIDISVTAPNDDGMVKVALDVPVIAIATTDSPITWYVRGGLNNGDIDAGITPNFAKAGKIGGAVVLGFGTLTNFPVIDLIPSTWIPATP